MNVSSPFFKESNHLEAAVHRCVSLVDQMRGYDVSNTAPQLSTTNLDTFPLTPYFEKIGSEQKAPNLLKMPKDNRLTIRTEGIADFSPIKKVPKLGKICADTNNDNSFILHNLTKGHTSLDFDFGTRKKSPRVELSVSVGSPYCAISKTPEDLEQQIQDFKEKTKIALEASWEEAKALKKKIANQAKKVSIMEEKVRQLRKKESGQRDGMKGDKKDNTERRASFRYLSNIIGQFSNQGKSLHSAKHSLSVPHSSSISNINDYNDNVQTLWHQKNTPVRHQSHTNITHGEIVAGFGVDQKQKLGEPPAYQGLSNLLCEAGGIQHKNFAFLSSNKQYFSRQSIAVSNPASRNKTRELERNWKTGWRQRSFVWQTPLVFTNSAVSRKSNKLIALHEMKNQTLEKLNLELSQKVKDIEYLTNTIGEEEEIIIQLQRDCVSMRLLRNEENMKARIRREDLVRQLVLLFEEVVSKEKMLRQLYMERSMRIQ